MVNTKVTLCGIEMDNPIIPASGTFGFGYEFAELYDINMLGTFSFKGTTREPRFGNPTPRIAEYAGGLLNAVGLQNPGVDAVIETELPKLKQVFHKPVMANISGFSVAEYAEVCEKLDAQEQVGWLEVNISCPNVHGGGAAFGADPKSAAEVTKAVRAVTKKPIILKLSPTAANIAAVAKACEDEGADGVSLINTMPGMRIDLKRRRPLHADSRPGAAPFFGFRSHIRIAHEAVYLSAAFPHPFFVDTGGCHLGICHDGGAPVQSLHADLRRMLREAQIVRVIKVRRSMDTALHDGELRLRPGAAMKLLRDNRHTALLDIHRLYNFDFI